MDAQDTGEHAVTYDPRKLAASTPWSERQWSDARNWLGNERFTSNVPLIIEMGGEPRAMAEIIRRAEASRPAMTGLPKIRAKQYAEALVIAALAEQRQAALLELLEEAMFRADQAESLIGALEYGENMPTTWTPGVDEAPPPHVKALIDLNGGAVYARYLNTEDWYKPDAGRRNLMVYRWPIPDSGPFIALPDDWDFSRVVWEREKRADEERQIRDLTRHQGYRIHATPVEQVRSQIEYDQTRYAEKCQEVNVLRVKLGEAERRIERLAETVENRIMTTDAERETIGERDFLIGLLPEERKPLPHHLSEGWVCRGSEEPGYRHVLPDGRLHCNRCGWES